MSDWPEAAPVWSWTQVCARRLERHALSAPLTDAEPADIVAAMCGAHAQVLTASAIRWTAAENSLAPPHG